MYCSLISIVVCEYNMYITTNGLLHQSTHCLISTMCGHVQHMLQVFHVPLEERRYTSEPASFGAESPQAGIVREIMEKTGCAIEMSQAKDQSLTIMVTGRPSAVSEAKRLINLRLHTQVKTISVL